MSYTLTRSVMRTPDHFEPEPQLDPASQRQMRARLEQIDYAAFAANQEVLGHAMGHVDLGQFERLAIAVATARSSWGLAALAAAEKGEALAPSEVEALSRLRMAFEELSASYEALRRMVERGYLPCRPKA